MAPIHKVGFRVSMAQWLTVFAVLAKDPSSVPIIIAESFATPVPGRMVSSSGLHRHQTYMWYT